MVFTWETCHFNTQNRKIVTFGVSGKKRNGVGILVNKRLVKYVRVINERLIRITFNGRVMCNGNKKFSDNAFNISNYVETLNKPSKIVIYYYIINREAY